MRAIVAGEVSAEGGDGVTQFVEKIAQLAHQVGPGWAFILVLTVCLLMPRIGVVPQIAKLIAADRIDKRKRTVEYQRLIAKFNARPAPPASAPPPLPGGGKKK